MTHRYIAAAAILLCFALTTVHADDAISTPSGKRWLINRIEARVNGSNILASDLAQPQLSNDLKPMSLKQAIRQELLVQRALKTHVAPSTVDIERQITASKIENHMTDLSDAEFEQQLKGMTGLTLPQYKQQVWRTLGAEQVKRAEIMDKIVVTSQEVENYCNANPLYTLQEFKLRIASLQDYKDHKHKSTKQLLADNLLEWDDIGWMSSDSIAAEYGFIRTMKPKSYSEPHIIHGNLVVVHLQDIKEPQLLTLSERYNDIAAQLTEERTRGLVADLEEALTQKATITFPPERAPITRQEQTSSVSSPTASAKK